MRLDPCAARRHLARLALHGADLPATSAGDGLPLLHSLRQDAVVAPGDVIRVRPDGGQVSVLFRRGANANALFVTERCNSRCLMCSQPPREEDDGWREEEIAALLPLIDRGLPTLGVTGGEPTLLGAGLARLIERARDSLPETRLHILTNGRRFADGALAAVAQLAQQ